MTRFWPHRRVLVTGGHGFLGSFLLESLEASGCQEVAAPGRASCDLTDVDAVRRLFSDFRPQVVFHLAASVGGIQANRLQPGRFFQENLTMGIYLIHEAMKAGVEKFVQVGTVCSYPKHTPVPFRESDLWNGFPEETNAAYGIAKKALLVQLQAYRDQYGLNGIYLIPTNLYGPRDNFDLSTSHVIPALIRKCLEANGAGKVAVWGTGKATRDFLFVRDCAQALVAAAERYNGPGPLNLGSGREVAISELASTVARLTGFEGELEFDPSYPDGQPRRVLDSSRARAAFGFHPKTGFEEGLRETVSWYLEHREAS
ncbi:MAG: GDP-L-fucose synthase [Gemmatimonadota bacterium]|jgi:GDP-L-fucose synthase